MKVSIIVPCRNECRDIVRFLETLRNMDRAGLDLEILVAEGGSDDGTKQILQTYCEGHRAVRIVENPAGIVSCGLNAAIRAARGEVIVRMDVHTQYASDYVQQCVQLLLKTGADNVGGPWVAKGDGYLARAIAAAFGSAFCLGGGKAHDSTYEGPVDTVYLGCWRRERLIGLGLFDEDLVRNQDDELNLRITRRGGTVWQSPQIRSWYTPRCSFATLFRQYLQYGFWKVKVIRKHGSPASWRHLVPGAFVAGNVALVGAAVAAWSVAYWTVASMCLWLWLTQATAYLVLSFLAAIISSKKHGWKLLPVMPIVFGAYHIAYGTGFMIGSLHFLRGSNSVRPHSWLTEITR